MEIPMKKDIVIIGAGAAGLICGYKLAKNTKKSVLILEKEAFPGKKLKAAGSGKCNITNKAYACNRYHSNDYDILEEFLRKHSQKEILSLFDEMGIAYYEQNGYYYPLSNQGKQVVELIQKRCIDEGMELLCSCIVTKVRKKDNIYILTYENEGQAYEIQCETLLFSTGGKASKKLGGSEIGYDILKSLGITITDIVPALCPIYMNDPMLKMAKGVRTGGTVSIKNKEGIVIKDEGQIQFNENHLSGICVMNLSSFFYPWMKEDKMDKLWIDFVPEYSWDEVSDFIKKHHYQFPEESLLNCLNSLLPNGLSLYIIAKCGYKKEIKIGNLQEKGINKITSQLKKSEFSYYNQYDYDKAQVTGGGVSLKEINIHTFESHQYKNLYILGELLDVNGDCGGYNITFAMLSALAAAEDIVNKMRNTYI